MSEESVESGEPYVRRVSRVRKAVLQKSQESRMSGESVESGEQYVSRVRRAV